MMFTQFIIRISLFNKLLINFTKLYIKTQKLDSLTIDVLHSKLINLISTSNRDCRKSQAMLMNLIKFT